MCGKRWLAWHKAQLQTLLRKHFCVFHVDSENGDTYPCFLLLSGTFFLVEDGIIWFKFNLGECVMRLPKEAVQDITFEIIIWNYFFFCRFAVFCARFTNKYPSIIGSRIVSTVLHFQFQSYCIWVVSSLCCPLNRSWRLHCLSLHNCLYALPYYSVVDLFFAPVCFFFCHPGFACRRRVALKKTITQVVCV